MSDSSASTRDDQASDREDSESPLSGSTEVSQSGMLSSIRETSARLLSSIRRPGGENEANNQTGGSRQLRDPFLQGPKYGRIPVDEDGSGGSLPCPEHEGRARPEQAEAKFRHCFMRTLRPAELKDNPGVKDVHAKTVACASGGKLIIAGGSYMKEGQKEPRGWVAVWEQDGDSWKQWKTGLGKWDDPVNAISILGNMLVVGHSYPHTWKCSEDERFYRRTLSTEGSKSIRRPELVLGRISMWHISRGVEMLHKMHVFVMEMDLGADLDLDDVVHERRVFGMDVPSFDMSEVTAVKWLSNPVSHLDVDPPDGCILASASVAGIISLFKYSRTDRCLRYWTQFREPKDEDNKHTLIERSKISDLSFLSRQDCEDNDMLLACAYWTQKAVWILRIKEDDEEEPLKPATCCEITEEKRDSEDRTAGLADKAGFKTHAKCKPLKHPREVGSVRFRKSRADSQGDADVLLTACMDYSLRMWDVDNHRIIRVVKINSLHQQQFTSCIFCLQGNLMAAGSQSGDLMIFDTITGLKMRTMAGHTDAANKVTLLPGSDGGMLASASNDGTIRIWEIKSKSNSILSLGESETESKRSTVYALAFGQKSSRVVTVHRDCSVRSWDTATGRLQKTLLRHSNFVFGVDIHPSEPLAATAGHDGTVKLWNLDSGMLIQSFDSLEGRGQIETEEGREMSSVSFHPSGNLLIAGCYDGGVYLYTRDTGVSDNSTIWRTRGCWHAHENRVWAVAFSGDGAWMASGAWDNSVAVYRVGDIERLLPNAGEGPTSEVFEMEPPCVQLELGTKIWAVVFQPQEHARKRTPLLATGSADSILRLWSYSEDVDSPSHAGGWHVHCMLKGHTNTVTDIAWHPTGNMLVSSSFDKTVRLWGKSKSGFVGLGVWAAYSSATMAVGWAYQDPEAAECRGTVIAIATIDGDTYLMDATDAGQQFVPFGRAQHIQQNAGEEGAVEALTDIFQQNPQTLTSLGPKDSGIFLLWGITNTNRKDKRMLPMLLDSAQSFGVSPLLPYSPQNVAVLTLPDYQLVAAIVDTIIRMHEAGDIVSIELLSTGYGTLSILQLMKNYPDQAVVILNHFGMRPVNDDVYDQNWTPHQILTDGVRACTSTDPKITRTRHPKELWRDGERGRLNSGNTTVHTVAAHATFPHITGIPPKAWYYSEKARNMEHNGESKDHKGPLGCMNKAKPTSGNGKTMLKFGKIESTFLHVAYNSQDPLLFDTALGRTIIQYKWIAYGRAYFYTILGIYILQLAATTWQAISWGLAYRMDGCAVMTEECEENDLICVFPSDLNDTTPPDDLPCKCLNVHETCPWLPPDRGWSGLCVLLITGCQVIFEIYQVCKLGKRYFRKFGRSAWNVYELVLIVLLMAAGIVTVIPHPPKQYVPLFLSLAAFGCWFKLLYFARAFTSTAGLVRLIQVILIEMTFMFVVLAIGICSATVAFWALPPHQYFGESSLEDILENPFGMFFFVFSIMMSAYEVNYFTKWFSKACVLGFVSIQAIVLLNALIALMSETCEKVKEKIKVVALHERAGMLLDMELVLGKRVLLREEQCPRWLHALVKDKYIHGSNRKDRGGGGAAGNVLVPASGISRQEWSDMQDNISRLMVSHEHSEGQQKQMMQVLQNVTAILSRELDDKGASMQAHVKTPATTSAVASTEPLPEGPTNISLGYKPPSEQGQEGDPQDRDPHSVTSYPLSNSETDDAPACSAGGSWQKAIHQVRLVNQTARILASREQHQLPSHGHYPVLPVLSVESNTSETALAPRSITDRIRHKS